jgi:hypothetical protein
LNQGSEQSIGKTEDQLKRDGPAKEIINLTRAKKGGKKRRTKGQKE